MTRYKSAMPLDVGTASTVQPPRVARRLAAGALLAASAALDRLARRLALPTDERQPEPLGELEFYAQAGAPEGALYVDGHFVGWLQGVTRL